MTAHPDTPSARPGDRVRIRSFSASLKHRPQPVYGKVIRRDGGYIYVRPSWCHWQMEVYEGEIEVVGRWRRRRRL